MRTRNRDCSAPDHSSVVARVGGGGGSAKYRGFVVDHCSFKNIWYYNNHVNGIEATVKTWSVDITVKLCHKVIVIWQASQCHHAA